MKKEKRRKNENRQKKKEEDEEEEEKKNWNEFEKRNEKEKMKRKKCEYWKGAEELMERKRMRGKNEKCKNEFRWRDKPSKRRRGEWEGGVGKEVQANVGSRFILETRVVIWWA